MGSAGTPILEDLALYLLVAARPGLTRSTVKCPMAALGVDCQVYAAVSCGYDDSLAQATAQWRGTLFHG